MMMLWTRRRATAFYGMDFKDVTDVLVWMICGVFFGATLGGYLDHWSRYAASPVRLLYFWESGLSSGPGFLGGGLAALYKLRKQSMSPDNFAESASVPTAFMLFIGRLGCFLAGCCRGVPTSCPLGIRFPENGHVHVVPSQLMESFAALLIGIFLLILDKKRVCSKLQEHGAVLGPLFFILYGAYRLIFDFWRAGDRIFGFRVGQYTGLLAIVVGIGWLAFTLKRSRAAGAASR